MSKPPTPFKKRRLNIAISMSVFNTMTSVQNRLGLNSITETISQAVKLLDMVTSGRFKLVDDDGRDVLLVI